MNLSLQQEIENIKNEVQFYQKEAQKMPELRKKNASMLTQIGALGKQQEEEKAIFAKTIQALEDKLADTAKEKQQSAEHFWNLTEANKKLRQEMDEAEEKNKDVGLKKKTEQRKMDVELEANKNTPTPTPNTRVQFTFEHTVIPYQKQRLQYVLNMLNSSFPQCL